MANIHNTFIKIVLVALLTVGLVNAAPVVITGSTGVYKDGSIITISGSGFTDKAHGAPLFYWSANGGIKPSSLGRKLDWDGDFNGELVTSIDDGAIIAPGSEKAIKLDFGKSEGAILGKVSFDADKLYIWRKRYDDFDADYSYAIRTRLVSLSRLVPDVQLGAGLIMATPDKSVVGRSLSVNITETNATVYYERDYGNINDIAFVKRVISNGDKVYLYSPDDTGLTVPIFEATINEGYGVFYTLNHKTIRFWGKYPTERNTTYISLGDGVDSPLALRAMVVNENTQTGTFWSGGWDSVIDHATKRWVNEEYQYSVSDIDVENGELYYWQNGIKGWDDKRFRFRTSTYPVKYSDLFMGQVSNGAQIGTNAYYDSLYIDDSWHRVIICESAVYSDCKKREIQVPLTWSDSELSFYVNLSPFQDNKNLYLYVVNMNGEFNDKGFSICRNCPVPPPGFNSSLK